MRYELPQPDEKQKEMHRLAILGVLAKGTIHAAHRESFSLSAHLNELRDHGLQASTEQKWVAIADDVDELAERLSELNWVYEGFRGRSGRLEEMVNECLSRWARRIASAEVSIDVDLDQEAKAALLPKLYVEQILGMLIENALRAVGRRRSKTRSVRVAARIEGDLVRIAVSDNGVGIRLQSAPDIFEPVRTSRILFRWDYCLFLVRALVQQLDGRIIVDSSVRRGSTFTVMLPRIKEAKA